IRSPHPFLERGSERQWLPVNEAVRGYELLVSLTAFVPREEDHVAAPVVVPEELGWPVNNSEVQIGQFVKRATERQVPRRLVRNRKVTDRRRHGIHRRFGVENEDRREPVRVELVGKRGPRFEIAVAGRIDAVTAQRDRD